MEKTPKFNIQDVQAILKTSERLNKHKDEIRKFLRIIEGFLKESGELDDFIRNKMILSDIVKINFSKEPLKEYSCDLYLVNIPPLKWHIEFVLYYMGIKQNVNVDGLSRHLVPIFYLALPEILEALVNLFPKLKENIQELIKISNMTQ